MDLQRRRATKLLDVSSDGRTSSSWHCKQSFKATIMTLLFWNTLVGFAFSLVLLVPAAVNLELPHFNFDYVLGAYILLSTVQILYPFGGLLADVFYGRYRVIMTSIVIICIAFFLMTISGILYTIDGNKHPGSAVCVTLRIIVILAMISFVVGFSGFKSNVIQFSLDQLLDVPSERVSLFLHWSIWTECLGNLMARLIVTSVLCNLHSKQLIAGFSSFVFVILSAACLFSAYCMRNRFYCEKVSKSPYWNVWKVLKFTFKVKPLGHRSAFTYSDDIKPSKMDFAKRIYGGPFETEVVEDVKTFLKMILMLFLSTPVFLLQVSASYLFQYFGHHLSNNVSSESSCSYELMLFQSGNLSSMVSVIAIPVYLVLVYRLIKKWIPRIVVRLGVGAMLTSAAAITMFIIQSVANHHYFQNNLASSTHVSTCLFLAKRNDSLYATLNYPSEFLAITSVLYGIGYPLTCIAVLEFISAQSPHTMKGLLLGVFYAFRGLFITLGSVATFPFVQESLWRDQHWMFDCGFYYYLSNSVFGVFGLVVFILAARWYQYRERDDPPYRYQYAEDYYSRCASQSRNGANTFRDSYGATK